MKSLKFVQWAWPVEVAVIVLVWLFIVFWDPERMEAFVAPLGFILPFIGAQASVAFGGKPLKTALENKRLENETNSIP